MPRSTHEDPRTTPLKRALLGLLLGLAAGAIAAALLPRERRTAGGF